MMKDKKPKAKKRPRSGANTDGAQKGDSSQFLTAQCDQLMLLFQGLSLAARLEVMRYAEELTAKEQEERAALEREIAHDEWLRNFDAKMKAEGIEYSFVDDIEGGLTSEQRWNMAAEILATVALRVMRKKQEQTEHGECAGSEEQTRDK